MSYILDMLKTKHELRSYASTLEGRIKELQEAFRKFEYRAKEAERLVEGIN